MKTMPDFTAEASLNNRAENYMLQNLKIPGNYRAVIPQGPNCKGCLCETSGKCVCANCQFLVLE
jgi:hypothetical protein